jgi:outer membrane protein TolC
VGVRRDPPELALQHRSDRDGYGADYRNTVRVALRIPLGTDARNAPRIAAAGTALAQAEAILLHLRRRLDVDRAHALAALDAAERQVRLSSDRLALAREHEALVERAFAMGEQSLVALLRSAALREDAQAETERAEIGVGLMRSRLAQVSGVMPRTRPRRSLPPPPASDGRSPCRSSPSSWPSGWLRPARMHMRIRRPRLRARRRSSRGSRRRLPTSK